jgi:HME family heavy-metal exporter
VSSLPLNGRVSCRVDEGRCKSCSVAAGTSLEASNHIAQWSISGSKSEGRPQLRRHRAELDEHAEGVNTSEIIISFDPDSGRTREEILAELREELTQVPGVIISVEQPLQHLISHMLSGVKAQVGIKLWR